MKVGIPKGTRDFSPTEVAKRTYIINTIKTAFENFGFQPIETPSFENSSTLMGKYGEEGDRLIFKILNSGDYIEKFKKSMIELIFLIQKKHQDYLKNIYINNSSESEIDKLATVFSADITVSSSLEITRIINEIFGSEQNIKGISINDFITETILLEGGEDNNSLIEFTKLNEVDLKVKASILFNKHIDLINSKYLTPYISEKALKYDLTVPFARYVVQHQNEITFPFKRYQIQPVWRADRPQKGRFREFYQCDADVVGSQSLWQEVEFIKLYDTVFSKLGLHGTTIKMNNRKILSGIAEVIGAQDKLIDFTVALDKLDKIGQEKVEQEMLGKGISEEAIQKLLPLFSFNGTNQENLDALANLLATSEEGTKGVEELRFLINSVAKLGLQSASLTLDVTLARGLNYYTGAIFEVAAPETVKMGSIGGGGRYDDLTGIFGMKDMSGVGISFGLDRIYLVLEELNLFKEVALPKPKVLFINFGEAEALFCLHAITKLREKNIKAELYPDAAKMKKQMTYANKREIPFVVLVGSKEIENDLYTLKNMNSGEQTECGLEELINQIS